MKFELNETEVNKNIESLKEHASLLKRQGEMSGPLIYPVFRETAKILTDIANKLSKQIKEQD